MAIYGIAILYLAVDLYLIGGPLSKVIDRMQGRGIEEQIAQVPTGLVATVNTWPITVADLERGVWEYCTVRGLHMEALDAKRLEVIRAVVLSKLIDELAVWHFARVNPVAVDGAEVDAAVAQVRKNFGSDEDFAAQIAAQGMDAARFREFIADRVHQQKWLEAKAAKHISVSDGEVRSRYETGGESRQVPERWRARHIFMATLDKDPLVVRSQITAVKSALDAGELSFEEAAAEHSEDARTKGGGGDLGYFSSSRMPEDFIAHVEALPVGETSGPCRTELGWHLIQVTGKLPAREATLDEMRDEIRAYLETQKRKDVIDQIVRDMRKRSKIWPPEPKPQAILSDP